MSAPLGESLEDQLHRVGPSLRVRALLVLTAVSVAPLVVASVASERTPRDPEAARTTLLAEARTLARQLEHDDMEAARARLRAAHAHDGGRYRLVNPGGAVLATVGSSHRPNLVEQVQAFVFGDDQLPPAPAIDHLREAPSLADSLALARARGEHASCRPAAEGRYLSCHAIAACGPRFVVLERAERRSVGALVEERYQLLRLSFFVLPWALLLGAWLAWRMIRPIERLRGEVERRAQMSAPTADLPVTRKDELGALAHAFNHLAQRLSDRGREHEAFVADLAHEFKSPVAALRSAADKLAEGQHDPARIERLARVIGDSSERLQRVLDDFLELAHAEAGLRAMQHEAVDVLALVRALVAAPARAEAHPGKALVAELVDATATVQGVPDRLEAALANLLDNALAFAASTVTVSVTGRGDSVHITVADDGPGIAPEDREHVFERFFTHRSGQGGTGLGLALVRAIVEAHGGRVWVEPSASGGAAFVVSLPRA
jgi:signal transduction histidine kinase